MGLEISLSAAWPSAILRHTQSVSSAQLPISPGREGLGILGPHVQQRPFVVGGFIDLGQETKIAKFLE